MADPSWTSADVAKALCDALVASGKLRANPGFIREDREAKIATVFEYARLPLMHRAPAPPPPPAPARAPASSTRRQARHWQSCAAGSPTLAPGQQERGPMGGAR
eukprot:COSAG02_NODE_564_length_20286_cov_52.743696_7_plen_104_part_00